MVNANPSATPTTSTPTASTPADANITPSTIIPHQHEELEQQQKLHLFQLYFVKFVAILLMLQGLWALFNSIKFIFFELPQMEQQLSLGQINSLEINAFANKAIIMTISTILSLFFALRITVLQSKVAKAASTIFAVILVVGNTQINNFLNQIDSSQLISSTIIETLKSILSF